MKRLLAFLTTAVLLTAAMFVCVNAQTAEPVEITSMVLRPGAAGVYYKCRLTETGLARTDIAAWGVALSTQEMPDKDNMNEKCRYTRLEDVTEAEVNSVLLNGVLKEENSTTANEENLNTVIYARAYIETTEGEIVFGTGKSHTFGQLLTKVDEQWENLEPVQQSAVMTMYGTYKEAINSEETPNMDKAYQESQDTTEPETPDVPSYDADTAPEETAAEISIGILSQNGSSDYDTNALTLWLEEQTGYDIKVTLYDSTAAEGNNILTLMATGAYEMPDILMGFTPTDDTIETFGTNGFFTDLSVYYADEDGASMHFWNALNSNLTDAQKAVVMDKITASDGNIYTVPYISTTATGSMKYQAWINTQWLDALDLEMPTNAQELYDVLVAFLNNDPNGNGAKDEVPLMGSQRVNGAKVVDWLINMFIYYDSNNYWQPNGDAMDAVFNKSDYRAAMIYIHKLYEEELLSSMYATNSSSNLKTLYSMDMVGVMVGDLYNHTDGVSENLMDYVALPMWGCAVETPLSCKSTTFLSGNCETPNAAFRVLMELYSQDGQERMRYGAYGTDWTEADANTTSKYGIAAEYKVLKTPDTTSVWGVMACTLDRGSDSSLVQLTGELTSVQKHLQTQAAQGIAAFRGATGENKPYNIWIGSSSGEQTAIGSLVSTWQTNFITGSKDPADDYDWNEYLQALQDANLSNITYQMLQEYKNK